MSHSETPPTTVPVTATFPLGFLNFGVTGVDPGDAVTVTILISDSTIFNSYMKYGPTPDDGSDHWYDFVYDGATGAEILDDRIVLHFVDGQRGDHDLAANGFILDPGGPSNNTLPTMAFTDSGQSLGSALITSNGAALGDLDGDGDLDAFVVNEFTDPDEVWINQGGAQAGTPGSFADSGQSLGSSWSLDVELGDLDGDGDLDAFVVDSFAPNKVWINQGGAQLGTPGVFADSGQSLGIALDRGRSVALGDLDGDGDLDVCRRGSLSPGADHNQVWTATATWTPSSPWRRPEQAVSWQNGAGNGRRQLHQTVWATSLR